jgi:outer membrane receptor protein involved in Fe transport
MAGLPRHSAKLGADWALGRGLSVGADMQIVSSRSVQGNEDGLLEDGETDIHRLRIPGHTLLHLRLQWQATPALSVVARVQNALNKRYETYGALAETVFDAQGNFTGQEEDALFVAPGAPRSLWLGLRLKF